MYTPKSAFVLVYNIMLFVFYLSNILISIIEINKTYRLILRYLSESIVELKRTNNIFSGTDNLEQVAFVRGYTFVQAQFFYFDVICLKIN